MAAINYHRIIIVQTNGERFETGSTWGEEGDEVKSERDLHNHPAWTGSLTSGSTSKTSRMARFTNKYEGIPGLFNTPTDKE